MEFKLEMKLGIIIMITQKIEDKFSKHPFQI